MQYVNMIIDRNDHLFEVMNTDSQSRTVRQLDDAQFGRFGARLRLTFTPGHNTNYHY